MFDLRDDLNIDPLAIQEKYDILTEKGQRVSFNVILAPKGDRFTTADTAILHTVGLSKINLPEIAVYFGPWARGSSFTPEEVENIAISILRFLSDPERLKETANGTKPYFITSEITVRRYLLTPFTQEAREVVKRTKLKALGSYLKNHSYNLVLYTPSDWVH